jgi:DNA (cytosine-5)-methyltransferase 1
MPGHVHRNLRSRCRNHRSRSTEYAVDAGSTSVPTIRKGYNKGGSTDPYVRHPTNPALMRKLTPAEHARIKGVPSLLIEGLAATTAHEVLGQGVAFEPFRALFRALAKGFEQLRDQGPVWGGDCAPAARLSGAIG